MTHITYQDLAQWRAEGRDFQLIDVREPAEHAAFNIGGTLLPLGDLMQRLGEVDEGRAVVFYCKRGIRSQIAIQRLALRRPGGDFYNLAGGLLPLMPPAGEE